MSHPAMVEEGVPQEAAVSQADKDEHDSKQGRLGLGTRQMGDPGWDAESPWHRKQ